MATTPTIAQEPGASGRRSARASRPSRRARLVRAVRRHPFRTVLLVLLTVLLLGGLVLPAIAAVPLLSARDAAERAQAALSDQDLVTARDELDRAHSRFAIGRVALRNPLVWTARLIPGLGHNLGAAGAVARSGELTAEAGLEAVEAILALPDGPATLAPRQGVIPLAPIEQVAPALRSAADRLQRAQAVIDGSPDLFLAGPVAEARAELRQRVGAVTPTVVGAAALAEQLPAFLGAGGPKRYFFGASNPAELRGSGGFIGAFAILEVEDGELRFGAFEPVQDMEGVRLDLLEPPHPDFAERYDRFGSAGLLHNINMTPDFPSAAIAIQRLYEQQRGGHLDGVILADPFAFAALLEVSGPAEVPGFTTIDHTTVVDFVANEAYGQFPSEDERKAVLGAVAAASLEGLLRGDADPELAAAALAEAIGDGHVLLFADDPQVHQAFATAGIDGRLPRGEGDFVGVVMNNSANNKADFYLDRTIRYRAVLGPRGKATAELEVELRNETPSAGMPGHVIGPNAGGLNAGDNRTLVDVFCAACELTSFERSHRGEDVRTETELGRTVHATEVRMPSGAQRTLELTWETPRAWMLDEHGEVGTYRLHLDMQSTIRPTSVEVEVALPTYMTVSSVSEGARVEGRTLRWHGETRSDVVIEVELARPETERAWSALRRLLGQPLVRLD